jgi:prepilin-type N-terminal cleavage/methylation domain-containing protein
MKSRKGFTLVELMVVILIVAILAAVAIPILRGRIDAAKWAEGKSMMGTIATSIRAYCAEQGIGTTPTTPPGGSLPDTVLGFALGDCEGTYFGDADFVYTIDFPVTSPPTFTVTCTSGAKTGAPTTPGSWILTGAADGTTVFTTP